MKDYEAYIFDLYGTLIDIHTDDTKPSVWKMLARFFREHGADYSDRDLRKYYLQEIKNDERDILSENADVRCPEADLARILRRLYENKGMRLFDGNPLIEETAALLRKEAMCHIRLYAGVKEMLSVLKADGKKVILLSNAQRLFTIPEMESLGILKGYFDEILLSSDLGAKKPDLYFFRQLFSPRLYEKYHLAPKDCLMIGNDLRCDIEGAKEAGMDAYFILSGLSPAKDKEIIKAGEKTAADYTQIGMNWKKTLFTIVSKNS